MTRGDPPGSSAGVATCPGFTGPSMVAAPSLFCAPCGHLGSMSSFHGPLRTQNIQPAAILEGLDDVGGCCVLPQSVVFPGSVVVTGAKACKIEAPRDGFQLRDCFRRVVAMIDFEAEESRFGEFVIGFERDGSPASCGRRCWTIWA